LLLVTVMLGLPRVGILAEKVDRHEKRLFPVRNL
jgi:hypothetical protein